MGMSYLFRNQTQSSAADDALWSFAIRSTALDGSMDGKCKPHLELDSHAGRARAQDKQKVQGVQKPCRPRLPPSSFLKDILICRSMDIDI
jgi:hypothetical protein